MSVSWRPPDSLTVEVIKWDLPIVLHPFDPFIASDVIYYATNSVNNSSAVDVNRLVLT